MRLYLRVNSLQTQLYFAPRSGRSLPSLTIRRKLYPRTADQTTGTKPYNEPRDQLQEQPPQRRWSKKYVDRTDRLLRI